MHNIGPSRPKYIFTRPSAVVETGSISGRRLDSRLAVDICEREFAKLLELLQKPQRICDDSGSKSRKQHAENETADFHANG